jgi:cation diffusion facilitator CzcD-associated flavoprotein CzcO
VWYWASPIEARLCRSEEAVLVGGGNSAGQAVVYLSGFAKKIWMLVRGPGLAESMSQYLIDRISATANIEVLFETEVTALTRLSRRTARSRALEKSKDWRRDRTSNPQPVPFHRRRPSHRMNALIWLGLYFLPRTSTQASPVWLGTIL